MTFIILLSSSASAFDVTHPSKVTVGDDITINGTGVTNKYLLSSAEFETYATPVNKEYEYEVEYLKIPSSPEGAPFKNKVTATAYDVKDMKVTVSIAPVFSVGPSAYTGNIQGIATLSMPDVPAVTYPLITINGTSRNNEDVNLKFKCESYIETNSGNFEYTYNTGGFLGIGGVPTGSYLITINDGTDYVDFSVQIVEASSSSMEMVTITSKEIGTYADETIVEENIERADIAAKSSVKMSVTDETKTVEQTPEEIIVTNDETDDQASEEMAVANDEPQDSSSILGKVMSWLLKII